MSQHYGQYNYGQPQQFGQGPIFQPPGGGGGGGFDPSNIGGSGLGWQDALSFAGGPAGIAANFGGKILGSIGGDPNKQAKRDLSKVYGAAMGSVGEDIFDIPTLLSLARSTSMQDFSQYGKAYDRQYGFDQGRSAGANIEAYQRYAPQRYEDLYRTHGLAKSRRDQQAYGTALSAAAAQMV